MSVHGGYIIATQALWILNGRNKRFDRYVNPDLSCRIEEGGGVQGKYVHCIHMEK